MGSDVAVPQVANFLSEETLHHRNAKALDPNGKTKEQFVATEKRSLDPNGKTKEQFVATEKRFDKVHPSLRGGQPPGPHSFSESQMEVLTALCETILPSLPLQASDEDRQRCCSAPYDAAESPIDVQASYKPSVSDWQVPEYAAAFMTTMLKPFHLLTISIVLLLLSTRLGTLVLCGRHSLTSKFPYLQSFQNVSLQRRERIMRGWCLSSSKRFQELFKVLKSTVGWNCFSRVDGRGCNPTWNAIGYYVPTQNHGHASGKARNESSPRPLDGKVIDVRDIGLCDRLQENGFSLVEGMQPDRDAHEHGERRGRDVRVKCDVVVVGSGSGGGVVAGVLAKAGYQVLVLEKGEYFAREDYSCVEGPSSVAMAEGPAYLASEDSMIIVKAGATVGGGSSINWSASIQTPEHVLKEWAEDYNLGIFTNNKYKQAMDAVCERMNVQEVVHNESLQNAVLRKGCLELGYHVDTVPCNAGPDHYCGWCEFGCVAGEKKSTPETWLVDAVSAGALILSGCKAQNILHAHNLEGKSKKQRRAQGVVALVGSNGINRLFIDAQATIVACGALNTPPLLKRSGLHNPNIGKNLHLHPSILAWGYIPEEASNIEGKVFEGGIITAYSRVCARWDSDGYGSLLQCPCIHPGSFSVISPWCSGQDFKQRMLKFSRTSLIFTLTRDRTCGTVQEGRDGRLKINYSLSAPDKERILEAVQHAVRILAAVPGVKEVGTMSTDGEVFNPGEASKEGLEEYLGRVRGRGFKGLNFSVQSAHQMGSCRMGVDPSNSVVDARGETWEVEGLFLGDTSVFPTALGVNPMVTVQAIAYCTAQNVVEYLKH